MEKIKIYRSSKISDPVDLAEICTFPSETTALIKPSLRLSTLFGDYDDKQVVPGHSFGSFEFISLYLSRT